MDWFHVCALIYTSRFPTIKSSVDTTQVSLDFGHKIMTGAIFHGTVMGKLVSKRFHGRPGGFISILSHSAAVHCTLRKNLRTHGTSLVACDLSCNDALGNRAPWMIKEDPFLHSPRSKYSKICCSLFLRP
ncbi:unnamed protein product [Blumeria hordei]|uniref:Uncharacterized protein n=2 Tax=Blumeria hordei TaxID=2867405 RepID=A0A383UQ99_BLUHO|nr:hypothetical protein BGHDH14_bghG000032000002001 [Blumeria hordei DH14]SZF02057.1 unnamed protein product [Blumeria hordei]